MEKLDILLVDLDDVIFLDGFLNLINKYLNTNYTYQDFNGYYAESLLTREQLIEYRKYFKEHNVYDYCTLAPHCKEVLMKLMLYYDIYIASKYYSDLDKRIFPELIPHKCEAIMKELPFIPQKNFIFINDKSLINAQVRIDDSIDNLKGSGLKLLYSAYHNKDISNIELNKKEIVRVNDWLEIENILLSKEKTKKIERI